MHAVFFYNHFATIFRTFQNVIFQNSRRKRLSLVTQAV